MGTKWLNKLFGWDDCQHDWEVVEHGHYWMLYDYWNNKTHSYIDHFPDNMDYRGGSLSSYQAKNRVCVKCGECDNGVERFKLAYEEQERKKLKEKIAQRRRKAWARQLWKDGCKNK